MSRIVSPLARVKIGSDEFVSGDGILKAVSVDLGEDKKSSKCQINLFDKGLLIGAKYQSLLFIFGSIATPEGLLGEKKAEPSSAPASPSSDPSNVTTRGKFDSECGIEARVTSIFRHDRLGRRGRL